MQKLPFDFIVNREAHEIHVRRAFTANLQLVWNAWTQAALLDQWWAPKPYRAQTKHLNFEPGGYWLYAMISPQEEYFWCRADYTSIHLLESFQYTDAFCNEAGIISTDFPSSRWTNQFSTINEQQTLVDTRIQMDNLADLEKMIASGFKEGFTMGLDNLEQLLNNQTNH